MAADRLANPSPTGDLRPRRIEGDLSAFYLFSLRFILPRPAPRGVANMEDDYLAPVHSVEH
jgi:hypothetical protein